MSRKQSVDISSTPFTLSKQVQMDSSRSESKPEVNANRAVKKTFDDLKISQT
jgi:hypothetical protein